MRAGRFRHRVTIKDRVVTRDTYGEEDVTWADVATVWADVQPIRGREYLEMDQAQADLTHRVWLRWRTGVEPTMRLYLGSRVLQIESVIRPEERRIGLELICRELVDV
jgi:SPP1 family predicted phage head-tail adaptor